MSPAESTAAFVAVSECDKPPAAPVDDFYFFDDSEPDTGPTPAETWILVAICFGLVALMAAAAFLP